MTDKVNANIFKRAERHPIKWKGLAVITRAIKPFNIRGHPVDRATFERLTEKPRYRFTERVVKGSGSDFERFKRKLDKKLSKD